MRVFRALTSPTWISRFVALLGVIGVISSLSPPFRRRLLMVVDVIPHYAPAAAAAGTAAAGVVLIYLSQGLRRRKFRAWLAATVLAAISVVLHLVKGLDAEEATLALAVLALLVAGRPQFTARPDPRSTRMVLTSVVLATISGTVLGWLFLTLFHLNESPATTPADRALEAFLGLVGIPGPIQFVDSAADTRSQISLLVIGTVVVVSILGVALRPAGGPHTMTPEDAARIRDLLSSRGDSDSLSYFTTRDDRCAIFSPSGKAAVSYRIVGGVSLAGGDPVGDPEAWPSAIAAWLEDARRFGRVPAILGASARGGTAYQRAGLEVLELGDEAILQTATFTLEGRPMRAVRQALARVDRAGYTIRVDTLSTLTTDEADAIRVAANAWRDGEVERGFSMALGRLCSPADPNVVLVRAIDAEGRLRGVLQLVPWGRDGLSLDVMRRDRDSENGTVEAMVSALMAQARARDIVKVSLNFAVFRGVFERGERLGADPIQRLERDVLLWASRFWQIEALYRANAKYHPLWSPRYLVYEEAGDLPAVTFAVLRAEAFIDAPSWSRPLLG